MELRWNSGDRLESRARQIAECTIEVAKMSMRGVAFLRREVFWLRRGVVVAAVLMLCGMPAIARDGGPRQAAEDAQEASERAAALQQLDRQVQRPSERPGSRTAKPFFHPRPGKFASARRVEIRENTPHASIFYTTDGTQPTTSSTRYTGPILVSSTIQLKALAQSPHHAPSKVKVGSYVIK